MQNSIDDLYSYFAFLGYMPYCKLKAFKRLISLPLQRQPEVGAKRLQACLQARVYSMPLSKSLIQAATSSGDHGLCLPTLMLQHLTLQASSSISPCKPAPAPSSCIIAPASLPAAI